LLRQYIQNLLAPADIHLNGNRPWDIKINNERVFLRVLRGGILALGESYMDGDWDCERIDQLVERVLRGDFHNQFKLNPSALQKTIRRLARLKYNRNQQSTEVDERDRQLAETHYDLGNDLFEGMLGQLMLYTCAYFKDTDDLDEAQETKCRLICEKLGLQPGMKCLDIGGGFGEFAKYAVEKYSVEVVNITISKEQAQYARELCKGLAVDVRLMSYKELKGSKERFDAVWSIGMFEAVPHRDHPQFIQVVYEVLKELGPFLLHTIERDSDASQDPNPWIDKYIFPGGFLPSESEITTFTEHGFLPIDNDAWAGSDYDKTLMAWYTNFEKNWRLLHEKYGERFYRMWRLYLLGCAGSFRAERMRVHQHLFRRGITVVQENSNVSDGA